MQLLDILKKKSNRLMPMNVNCTKKGMEELLNLNSGIEISWAILKDDLLSIHSLLKSHFQKIDLPINISDFSFLQEVQAFLGIPLEILNVDKINKCPVDPIQSCLLRNNFEGVIGKNLTNLAPILTSWEVIVEMIRQNKILLRHHQEDVSRELKSLKQMKAQMSEQDFSSSRIKELFQKTKDFDKTLKKKVIPLLDNVDQIQNMSNEKLKDLKNAVHNWWTQPAQHISKYL